ncbi:glycosyltransferase family 4 protein [Streptomyces sp. HC44]|uniref:D-inositol 3-phosphate glycosyltransferase n=1 Tax=Streptomyces scabichelini TaxID=2711217 RepID=A0A6G4VIE8_9ACTN|nr:glycosyltransferase family 4 protein [Streptomyces scabichelini]NGO13741.1 glycosyltransferase family 4 protein [Streptomyces scabichelini]
MRIRYLLLHAYGTGGTIRTVFNQANSMRAAGHDVELISVLRRRDRPRFHLDPRIPVTVLVDERDSAGADRRRGRGLLTRRRTRRPPRHIPRGEFGIQYFTRYVEDALVRHLRGVHGGVLVSTRPALNILAARYAPSDVVLVAQDHMNLSVYKADVRAAIARHYPRFDAVAVLTDADRQEYARILPGTRIVRIPNAVHAVRQRHTTYAAPIAVAAGRLFRQKGFDLLILAFKQAVEHHPDWQLRIYGSGERHDELRALIDEHHLYNHVLLMGTTDELDEELAKASFYVLSSRFEGLPMVMIEAMTHGLPVVSFDCPTGPAEVITDGKDGLLVPPENVDALAEAMRQLMADEGLRADMGATAAVTARSYAPEVVHPQWERLFAELHEARRSAGRLVASVEGRVT